MIPLLVAPEYMMVSNNLNPAPITDYPAHDPTKDTVCGDETFVIAHRITLGSSIIRIDSRAMSFTSRLTVTLCLFCPFHMVLVVHVPCTVLHPLDMKYRSLVYLQGFKLGI